MAVTIHGITLKNLNLLTKYQTKNPSYIANKPITPVGVLVHDTASGNPWLKRFVDFVDELGVNQYGNHMNSANATISMHAWIGKDKTGKVIVVETLPYDRACWGCGNGSKGSYNYNPQAHIQFEQADDGYEKGTSTQGYFDEMWVQATEYVAYLCLKFGWTEDKVTSHYEAWAKGYASNHGDPKTWYSMYGKSMDMFRACVKELLQGYSNNIPGHTDNGILELKVGDNVQFKGGYQYNSASTSAFDQKVNASFAQITNICKGAKHPYHIRRADENGNIMNGIPYGWVDADTLVSCEVAPEQKPYDMFDVMHALKIAAGIISFTKEDLMRLDTNKDNIVDIQDVIIILKTVTGIS